MKIQIMKSLYLNAFKLILDDWSKEINESDISIKNSSIKVNLSPNNNSSYTKELDIVPKLDFLDDIKDPDAKKQIEDFITDLNKLLADLDDLIE